MVKKIILVSDMNSFYCHLNSAEEAENPTHKIWHRCLEWLFILCIFSSSSFSLFSFFFSLFSCKLSISFWFFPLFYFLFPFLISFLFFNLIFLEFVFKTLLKHTLQVNVRIRGIVWTASISKIWWITGASLSVRSEYEMYVFNVNVYRVRKQVKQRYLTNSAIKFDFFIPLF